MTLPVNDPLFQEILRLRADVDALLKREQPNQALDTASGPTFAAGVHVPLSTGSEIFGIDGNGTGATVADNGTFTPFGAATPFSGLFIVNSVNGGGLAVFITGGSLTVTKVAESVANVFTVTATTPSRINVYIAGANVVTIENKLGSSAEIRVLALRTRNAI